MNKQTRRQPPKWALQTASLLCMTLACTFSFIIYFYIEASTFKHANALKQHHTKETQPLSSDAKRPILGSSSIVQPAYFSTADDEEKNVIHQNNASMLEHHDLASAPTEEAEDMQVLVAHLPKPAQEFIRLEGLQLSVNQRIDRLEETFLDKKALEQLEKDIDELLAKSVLLPADAQHLKKYIRHSQDLI